MATTNNPNVGMQLNRENLDKIFGLLDYRLYENNANPIEVVVCGDSSLILTGMVSRTTKDVDILALKSSGALLSPDPLPVELLKASKEVAEDLGLPDKWLNNAPSQGEGGLFQMGLPEGLQKRLHSHQYGSCLTVHFIDRLDQIFFKLYASADRGGYHIDDLLALKPSEKEIEKAAKWAMSHDVSEGFRMILKKMLGELQYEETSKRL
jgi:hypothetical protein